MHSIFENPFLSEKSINLLLIIDDKDSENFVNSLLSYSCPEHATPQELSMYIAAVMNSFSDSYIFPKLDIFYELLLNCIIEMSQYKQNLEDNTFTFDDVSDIAHILLVKKLLNCDIESIALYSFAKIK